jgi:hypothetical protein
VCPSVPSRKIQDPKRRPPPVTHPRAFPVTDPTFPVLFISLCAAAAAAAAAAALYIDGWFWQRKISLPSLVSSNHETLARYCFCCSVINKSPRTCPRPSPTTTRTVAVCPYHSITSRTDWKNIPRAPGKHKRQPHQEREKRENSTMNCFFTPCSPSFSLNQPRRGPHPPWHAIKPQPYFLYSYLHHHHPIPFHPKPLVFP